MQFKENAVQIPPTTGADRSRQYQPAYREPPAQQPATGATKRQNLLARVLLVGSMLMGAISHGYHLFLYPLYITDEGIYMEQAWSVVRQGTLSPYTYFYDHAPAGWLVIAAWTSVLPHQFETFGNAINTGRVLMLLVHIASTFLLFQTTRRLSGNLIAPTVACFLFNMSPLAVYYQRQVLLDNLMVFWLLLSLYLITNDDQRVLTPLYSGLALGIGILTKENAIFFAPVIVYLLYKNVRQQRNYRFVLSFWLFAMTAIVSLYVLYATLKNELLPTNLNFNLNHPPADHVALLFTIWWEFHRSQGSIFDIHSPFWTFSLQAWLPKDKFILAGGAVAVVVNLIRGLRDRAAHRGELVASLLALGYIFYLCRGSVMLEFYVVPLLPLLAMNVGMLAGWVLRVVPELPRMSFMTGIVRGAIVAAFCVELLLPVGGYLLNHDMYGKVVPHDLYKLPLTPMQAQQLAFIRHNISPNSRIVMDDDLWVELHDVKPYYPYAHSHWKASGDPAVRNKLFAKNWQNIDYIVMSNKMLIAMQQNNSDGNESYIIEALSHGKLIWQLTRGDIQLSVYQIQK
jgi:4-amino-4-deoxy-L-arabinose transferase-like glycosyltransferase